MSNNIKLNKTVSDVIDINKFDKSKINIVKSGTGSGKSWYFLNKLHKDLGITKEQIIFITSRTITKEQQFKDYKDTILLNCYDQVYGYLFNLDRDFGVIEGYTNKTPIITYNSFYNLIDKIEQHKLLNKISCVILDEFHSIFSDATFNKEMQNSLNLILELLQEGNTWIFAGTGTDDDLKYYDEIKDKLNYVLSKPIFPYKVENIHFVKSTSLLDKVINGLEGKTLCMLYSRDRVLKYKEKYSNSGALISVHREEFKQNKEMQELYDYIIENKTLPEDVNIVFCTSMAREGYEFKSESNIENIIIESSDPVMIKQFVGRCRTNIKNLYIVNSYYYNNIATKTEAQKEHNREFLEYINNKSGKYLFHLKDIRMYENRKYIHKITFDNIKTEFFTYIIDNWTNKVIYTKEQKDEIKNYAFELGIKYTQTNNLHTFNSLVALLEENNFTFIFKGETVDTNNLKLKKYITEEIKKETIRPYIINLHESCFKEYLSNLVNQSLDKEQQQELKRICNLYFDLDKEINQVNKLNVYLKKLGYEIIVIRPRIEGKQITHWKLIKL